MAIVAPIAGAYTGTINPAAAGAVALNYTRQGFNLNFTQKNERVEETDLFGLCLIELVGRGAQMTIDCICKIYNSATRDALFPWSGATGFGRVYNAANPIGKLASGSLDALVFTAVASTSAAASPATLTAPSVKLSPDNSSQIVLSSVVREVPLKWDVLMTESAGISPQVGSLFTTT